MNHEFFTNIFKESIEVKQKVLADTSFVENLITQAKGMLSCLQSGGTIWFCGNGGSAADAQHLAAELSGRFYLNRRAYAAEALHVNSSFVTAVANDFGYDHIYERAVDALAKKGDVLIAISTSGNSKNILLACQKAKEKGLTVYGWSGLNGGQLALLADSSLLVPSSVTPRIQEVHITAGHILCQWVEAEMVRAEEDNSHG
ncbi:MAG: SIS domain-containing protein [Saprospiraceae bacterium]|nr:SIS domain-containing protein [Saprospiraceae bacterium]